MDTLKIELENNSKCYRDKVDQLKAQIQSAIAANKKLSDKIKFLMTK